MLAGLFITCVIATILADEIKFGYVLAGISYFLFAFYGMAKIITSFPIR